MPRVYFMRHKWNEGELGEFLKKHRLFGIHYVDEPRSVKPEDYTGGCKRILTALHGMGSEDLICSSFDDEFIEIGPLDKEFGIQLRDCPISAGSNWVLKVGRHTPEKRRTLYFSEYPMLLAAMPRQGTFGEWHLMRDQVLSIYRTGRVEFSYSALAPPQIEALCTSYLFGTGQLVCQSLPFGRTLPDIDIVGLDPRGERILAQVTFSKNRSKVREKAEALARYSALSPQLLFFAPAAMKDQIENQRFIPLEEVWDYWAKRSGGIFLKDFFGKGSDPTEPADRVRTLITDSANGQFFPIVEDGTAGVPGPVP